MTLIPSKVALSLVLLLLRGGKLSCFHFKFDECCIILDYIFFNLENILARSENKCVCTYYIKVGFICPCETGDLLCHDLVICQIITVILL